MTLTLKMSFWKILRKIQNVDIKKLFTLTRFQQQF